MAKFEKYKYFILVCQLVLVSLFELRGEVNMKRTPDVQIDFISIKDMFLLNPFEQFNVTFEIKNNSDHPVTFHSINDIIVTLSSNSELIYKRSLQLPVTSGELIDAMSEKSMIVVPEPITIMPRSKRSFTFNSFNTLPLITATTLNLVVTGIVLDGSVIRSDSIRGFVPKYTIIESNKTFLAEYINVVVNPVVIEMDGVKKVVVYYSNHPLFDKISTYYQHDKYPNYESIYAIFPCKTDIVKTIPINTDNSTTASNHMLMSLVYPSRIEIIKILRGGDDIIREYEKIAVIKSEKAKQLLKIKQYNNFDKLEFISLFDNAGQHSIQRFYKTMFGWEMVKTKKQVDLTAINFEQLTPQDIGL